MSVVVTDDRSGASNAATGGGGFWSRLAQALDRHFSDRSKRAIPPVMVRRSKYDIDRCRRMMRGNGFNPVVAPAGFGGMSRHRVVRVSR
jgi:hypothetical protein